MRDLAGPHTAPAAHAACVFHASAVKSTGSAGELGERLREEEPTWAFSTLRLRDEPPWAFSAVQVRAGGASRAVPQGASSRRRMFRCAIVL